MHYAALYKFTLCLTSTNKAIIEKLCSSNNDKNARKWNVLLLGAQIAIVAKIKT